MLQGRLMKRLRHLELDSFEAYCDYLFSQAGRQHEMAHMLDAVTTNKTDFFREPRHFDFLIKTALPELIDNNYLPPGMCARIWSAGCSSGEEPYSIAITALDAFGPAVDRFIQILATEVFLFPTE